MVEVAVNFENGYIAVHEWCFNVTDVLVLFEYNM